MIKSVMQSLPAYIMSVFKLPASIIKEIERTIRQFWWSQTSIDRKIHWFGWPDMTNSKRSGGNGP